MIDFAQQIASELGKVKGIAAVVLGGSWARGEAHADSDLDIGIYYHSNSPFSPADLRELAKTLDDSHSGEAVTDLGAWGPWINGGAWLTIQGQRVDWIYRSIERVSHEIYECRAGRPTVHYQPGHPHGFHNHIYMGEVFYCKPLFDPHGVLAHLKLMTTPYPVELKKALIGNLWEADFALETSRKSVERGDVFHVVGGFFRCAACLLQVIFALNERYWMNEKGAVKAAMTLPLRPHDFEPIVTHVLAHPGNSTDELKASLRKLEQLVKTTEELCS